MRTLLLFSALRVLVFAIPFGILLVIGWKARWAALALALYTLVALAVAHVLSPEQIELQVRRLAAV